MWVSMCANCNFFPRSSLNRHLGCSISWLLWIMPQWIWDCQYFEVYFKLNAFLLAGLNSKVIPYILPSCLFSLSYSFGRGQGPCSLLLIRCEEILQGHGVLLLKTQNKHTFVLLNAFLFTSLLLLLAFQVSLPFYLTARQVAIEEIHGFGGEGAQGHIMGSLFAILWRGEIL